MIFLRLIQSMDGSIIQSMPNSASDETQTRTRGGRLNAEFCTRGRCAGHVHGSALIPPSVGGCHPLKAQTHATRIWLHLVRLRLGGGRWRQMTSVFAPFHWRLRHTDHLCGQRNCRSFGRRSSRQSLNKVRRRVNLTSCKKNENANE